MPVDATWRIQSNSGTATGASGFTATLPNPTTDSSTLILVFAVANAASAGIAAQSFDPPFFQDMLHAGAWYAWRRPSQPAGETSWAITGSGIAGSGWNWWISEWGGLSSIGQPDAAGPNVATAAGVLTIHTDDGSGGITTADVADFAALAVYRAGPSVAWPAGHSYGAGASSGPSSWNEVFYNATGTGTGAADTILAIAEAYPGATGNVAGSITFDTSGGGGTPNSLDAWCVCYQPAAAPPPDGILTVGT